VTVIGLTVGPIPLVRRAEQRDVPRIAATLTVAVGDSRWARWALPDDGRIQRLTRWHELDAGFRGVETGTTWVTDDVDAVASWQAPDGAPGTSPLPTDVRAALARELPYLSGPRAERVARTRELVESLLPSGPHWELRHLGTRPSARRQGLGVAVLEPALARCDDDGVPAAAAVHTWATVRFLRRLGFDVTEESHTADDELPLWILVRHPVESGEVSSYKG
jgi:GNAT superfamily N-acetyltransferase